MDKEKLQNMINSLIDGNEDQARTVFHDYLSNKTREFIKDRTDKNSDTDVDEQ